MRRRLLRSLVVVLVLGVAALAARVGAVAGPGSATAIGTGGAAATVETLATQAAIETLSAGGNAVDAAVTAAAVLGVTEPFSCGIGGGGFMVIYRASDRSVTTIDGRESAPAAMRPDSFWENGSPLPFNEARYSGLSVGVPGTVETWDEALERYGTISLAAALAQGIRVAREGFVVDQTFFDQTQANVDWFDDIPASAALYLDPDGTPRDVGTALPQPGSRTHLRADRAPRGERLLSRRGGGCARPDGPKPTGLADRQPHLAPGTHDDARPARLHRARTGAGSGRLSRARRLRHGPALERRLDGGGSAEHPRGLSALDALARGGAALLPRSVSLLLRRPRRLSRGSRVLRRAADRAALGRLRGNPARSDHEHRGDEPGCAGRSVPVRRRWRREHPGIVERDPSRERRRTSRPPTVTETSSRTRSRSSPRAVRGWSSPAGASSRTTS